jgi:D-3-phosphoglycerate dehydrogenase
MVSNVPGRNAVAVAELTMGLILALDRRIADNVADARQGRWAKATYSKANGLLGSTFGILGMGSIGLAVAERAAGFGIRIGCLDRPGRSRATCDRLAELDVVGHRSLPELLASSDVVSLHLPSSTETKNLVDADFLSAMRPGSILVNTSRGDVVDEAALLAALDAGHVRAGLDVFAHEPASSTADWANPLAKPPRVVATHDIGASTRQAQAAIAAGVVEIVDGELGVPVADQVPKLGGAVAEVHQQVAGLLGDPGSRRMGGDPGEVYATAAVLDHYEHVEAAEQDAELRAGGRRRRRPHGVTGEPRRQRAPSTPP